MYARRLLWVLSGLLAVAAVFWFLLEGSGLEAERLNVGTLLGRDEPDPQVELWVVGLIFGVLAVVTAAAAIGFSRSER